MKTILLVLLLSPFSAFGQTYVGTFITVKGDVKILRTPDASSKGPFALVEGEKFEFEDAKIGKKVNPGERVQSGANGRAKIAYPNGDHFIVGNATVLVLPQIQVAGETNKKQSLEIVYGRVRSLISKDGPREKMSVKTPSAVAGVRGTDFFTRVNPTVGTQLTVLRGEVAVRSNAQPEKIQSVKTGFMTEMNEKTQTPKVFEAPKEELVQLQSESALKPSKEEIKSLDKEARAEIKQLNEQTTEAVLKDIKIEDPKLYNELKNKEKISADEIHTAVVAKLYKNAPSDKKRQKPSLQDIDNIGQDVYKKYFDNNKGQ